MSDQKVKIQDLKDQLAHFCEERDWGQFHGPKDLAIGVVTEGAELLEPFRFLSEEQCRELLSDVEGRQAIGEELADVLFFILRFCQRFDFDLSEVFQNKMVKNAKRYPVERFRGKNHKADKY